MNGIEERVTHLLGDIEELQVESEKSKAVFESAMKFAELMSEIKNENENMHFVIKSFREIISKQLEYLRDRIAIIQKVSPRTAITLHNAVNIHEKRALDYIAFLEKEGELEKITTKMKEPETSMKFFEMMVGITEILAAVETCYNCLSDTLDYVQGKETS